MLQSRIGKVSVRRDTRPSTVLTFRLRYNRKSHATLPLLPAPTPSQFPLDFAQLLQATATNPTRVRARGKPGKELRSGREKDTIIEEEEGWDLVDDVSV